MKRYGGVIFVEEGSKKEEYIRLHKKIPQHIAKLIFDCNLRNYSIFEKDNMLFTYFEYIGTDYEADMKKMAADEQNQKWWALVHPLMSPLTTRKEGETQAEMNSIFYQDIID